MKNTTNFLGTDTYSTFSTTDDEELLRSRLISISSKSTAFTENMEFPQPNFTITSPQPLSRNHSVQGDYLVAAKKKCSKTKESQTQNFVYIFVTSFLLRGFSIKRIAIMLLYFIIGLYLKRTFTRWVKVVNSFLSNDE